MSEIPLTDHRVRAVEEHLDAAETNVANIEDWVTSLTDGEALMDGILYQVDEESQALAEGLLDLRKAVQAAGGEALSGADEELADRVKDFVRRSDECAREFQNGLDELYDSNGADPDEVEEFSGTPDFLAERVGELRSYLHANDLFGMRDNP